MGFHFLKRRIGKELEIFSLEENISVVGLKEWYA